MKRKIGILIFLVGFLFNVKGVSAVFCDYTELAKYKRAAINIEHEIVYYEDDGNIVFEQTFYNLHPDIYIKDLETFDGYIYDENFQFATVNLKENKSYRFVVTTDKTECQNKELRIITIDIPKYNPLYKHEVCNGITDYHLCKKWANHNLSEADFIKAVNKYKASLVKPDVKEDNNFDDLLNWWGQNYFYFLSVIIVVGIPTIYYLYHKNDFDLRT